jgi:hypothetical protein
MTALPGLPSTPADVWSGAGVWHVSAIARLLVPDRPRSAFVATMAERAGARVPRPRSAAEGQRAAKTPAG